MAHAFSEEALDQERQHFRKIIAAFRYYRAHQFKRINESYQYFHELPLHHQELIPALPKQLEAVRTCVEHNYEIIKLIIAVANSDDFFEGGSPLGSCISSNQEKPCFTVTANDMDKVKSTLKQFVRDWAREGAAERVACYQPVVEDICSLFPASKFVAADVKVLVPGAGLGRLAWEIARKGYCCQGNEWSLFMLLSSFFVINKCNEVDSYRIYPWAHQFCNNWSWKHQILPVHFPDVRPNELPSIGNFSMAAGDFLEVYTEPETWDCVASVYFIDTAHNIVAYIETIWKILKPNGYWINLGPLLYHYSDIPGEMSIELDYENLRELIIKIGFEFVRESRDVQSGYTQNTNSMLNYQYNCTHFVVRKVDRSSPSEFSNNDHETSVPV